MHKKLPVLSSENFWVPLGLQKGMLPPAWHTKSLHKTRHLQSALIWENEEKELTRSSEKEKLSE